MRGIKIPQQDFALKRQGGGGGGGGGAYARGGVFAGHYGINNVHSIPAANAQSWLKITTVHISDSYFVGVGTRTGLQIKNIVMLEECYCAKQLQ